METVFICYKLIESSEVLSRLLQIGINGNVSAEAEPTPKTTARLSRLLQIGINGNENSNSYNSSETFPDYFKSELMETLKGRP